MTEADAEEQDVLAGRPGRGARWAKIAGAAIGVVGLLFVLRIAWINWDEVQSSLSGSSPALLPVALVTGLVAMTGIGLMWRAGILALGGSISVAPALRGYFVGQLGKYVPGGVWAVVGRGEWARSQGVPGPIAYSSVALSMGSAYLAAVMLAAILVPVSGILSDDSSRGYALVLLLLPVGLLVIHPVVLEKMLALVRRITGREILLRVPPWRTSAGLVAAQIPSWFLIGTVTILVAVTIGSDGWDAVNLISATAISWVVGFLVLPVPGGIGVRETVFVALATSLSPGVAATVALLARLIFVAVDASGAGLWSLVVARRSA